MTDNPEGAVKTMREKLQAGEYDIADEDADILLEMSDRIRVLGPSEYSVHRHEFLLRRTLVLAREVGGLAAVPDDRDAVEELVGHINSAKNDSPETNKDYRVALRGFGKIITDGDDYPETVEWIPGGYPSNYDPAPDPSEMLRWEEDIKPMLEACANLRDKALISLAFDLGPRPGELFDLAVGAVTDHKYGLQVTIQGKRGQRSPVLIPSVPHVNRWLEVHPRRDDPDALLFCRLQTGDEISNNRIRDILKEKARKADVTRPVTPTNFRKSSASYLASKGVSQAHLEDHHGWTRGSEVASRYVAVFSDANDREIAKAHGVDVDEDEPDPIGPIECPRCGDQTPRDRDICIHCNQALDQEMMELLDRVTQTLDDQIVKADDVEDREDLMRARRTIEDKPTVMDTDDLHELVSSLGSDD
jgi:hypothetical protein